jgi:hypothetical protein
LTDAIQLGVELPLETQGSAHRVCFSKEPVGQRLGEQQLVRLVQCLPAAGKQGKGENIQQGLIGIEYSVLRQDDWLMGLLVEQPPTGGVESGKGFHFGPFGSHGWSHCRVVDRTLVFERSLVVAVELDPVDAVPFQVEVLITLLKGDVLENQQAGRCADGQSEQVQQGVQRVTF